MWPSHRPTPPPTAGVVASARTTGLLVAVLLGALACGDDKSDSSTSGSDDGSGDDGTGDDGTGDDGTGDDGTGSGDDGTGDDGGGTGGEHAYFTRVYDDVYREGNLRTEAIFDMVATAEGVSGTITYTETVTDAATTICHTTLNIVRVASDPDCTDCTWGFTFFVEPDATTRTTGCVFPSPTTSFGLGDGGYLGTISQRATGPGGTQNVVTLGTRSALLEYTAEHTLYAEDSAGNVVVDSWNPSSGGVSGLSVTADASGPHLWQLCDVPEELQGDTQTGVPSGGTEVNDSVDCSLGPVLVDVWEAEVAAGQSLLASVDHSGDDAIMWLVDPKGCLLHIEDDSVACADDRVLCPAIHHSAAQDGTYRVVVGPLYCLNPTLNYFFDGVVQ